MGTTYFVVIQPHFFIPYSIFLREGLAMSQCVAICSGQATLFYLTFSEVIREKLHDRTQSQGLPFHKRRDNTSEEKSVV